MYVPESPSMFGGLSKPMNRIGTILKAAQNLVPFNMTPFGVPMGAAPASAPPMAPPGVPGMVFDPRLGWVPSSYGGGYGGGGNGGGYGSGGYGGYGSGGYQGGTYGGAGGRNIGDGVGGAYKNR